MYAYREPRSATANWSIVQSSTTNPILTNVGTYKSTPGIEKAKPQQAPSPVAPKEQSKSNPIVPTEASQDVQAKRVQAKEALLQMHVKGLGYQQLAEEVEDPVLLRTLYVELGLPLVQQVKPSPENGSEAARNDSRSSLVVASKKPASSSLPGLTDAKNDPAAPGTSVEPASSVEPGEVTDEEKAVPNASSAKAIPVSGDTKLIDQIDINGSKAQSPTSVQPKKPIERKDYIARLLAAKQAVKKPSEKPSSPTSNEPASTATSPLATEQKPEQKILSTVSGPTQPSVETKKPDMKDPVQTELIRRRLEALKNSKSLAKGPAQADIIGVNAPNETGHVQSQASVDTTLPPVLSSDHSFFTPSQRPTFGALPGLSTVTPAFLPGLQQPSMPQASANTNNAHDSHKPFYSVATPPPSNNVPQSRSRKRATAMDFIDSPPRESKRRMESHDSNQVVIEVSDDEERDDTEIDEAFVEENMRGSATSGDNSRDNKMLRDLPPITNAPSRGSTSSIARTPPVAQTPKALAAHEEDIKMLRQKILEYELRKKAKKAIAGKQLSSYASVAKHTEAKSLQAMEQLTEGKGEQVDIVNKQLVEQQESLGALEARISIEEKKLQADEETQALIVARAKNESQGAASATTTTERQMRLDRKATLEAALPKLESQIQSARDRMENIRKQQLDLEAEIEQSVKSREDLNAELKALLIAVSDDFLEQTAAQLPDDILEQPLQDSPRTTTISEQTVIAPGQAAIASEVQQDVVDDENGDSFGYELEPAAQTETLPEDVMDISSDSADEGQILDPLTNGPELQVPTGFTVMALQAPTKNAEQGSSKLKETSESSDDIYEPAFEAQHSTANGLVNAERQAEGSVSSEDIYESTVGAPMHTATIRGTRSARSQSSDSSADMYESHTKPAPAAVSHGERSSDEVVTIEDDLDIESPDESEEYEPRLDEPQPEPSEDGAISISSSSRGSSDFPQHIDADEATDAAEESIEPLPGTDLDDAMQISSGDRSLEPSLLSDPHEEGGLSDAASMESDYEPPESTHLVDGSATYQVPNAAHVSGYITNNAEASAEASSSSVSGTPDPHENGPDTHNEDLHVSVRIKVMAIDDDVI
jgi:hypothetical protein